MLKGQPTRLIRSEFSRSQYFITVPAGVPLDDILGADYFAHVFKAIKPLDLFEIVAEDGSYDVLARVVSKAPGLLKFRIVSGVETVDEPVAIAETAQGRFEARHRGRGTWGVIDRATGEWSAEGLDKAGAEVTAAALNAERLAA